MYTIIQMPYIHDSQLMIYQKNIHPLLL